MNNTLTQVAEKLYQKGFLSYPRTETDQFDPQFDHMSLIRKQKIDPNWGAFATAYVIPPTLDLCSSLTLATHSLEQANGFVGPRTGKNNDKAHPPIHPT